MVQGTYQPLLFIVIHIQEAKRGQNEKQDKKLMK
jgi:hypothetical protein